MFPLGIFCAYSGKAHRIIIMRLNKTMTNLDSGQTLILTLILTLASITAMMFYDQYGVSNPYYIISCYTAAQLLIMVLTGDFENHPKADLKKQLIYTPLKFLAGVLLALNAIPAEPLQRIFIIGVAGWFLYSGAKGVFLLLCSGWDKLRNVIRERRQDISAEKALKQQENEERQLREEARRTDRIETSLYSDLTDFLSDSEIR